MLRKTTLALVIGVLVCSASAFAQERIITQPIIINGQQVQGVLVIENGAVQAQTCPAPQPYVAADQSSSGWACFEPSTGMWLLHAQPPQGASAGPTMSYAQPPPLYAPAPAYGYGYYPFGYPYYGYPYIGPSFGFGFGFGPIIVNRRFVGGPFVNRPFSGRPFVGGPFISRPFITGRPVGPFVSRPFVGRPFVGGFRGGRFGRR